MADAKDIKLDTNGDLFISASGDFVIDFSDPQHIEDIFSAFAGWWKEFPIVGIGIKNYQSSSGKQQELERVSKIQLQADGFNTSGIKAAQQTDGTFIIDVSKVRR